MHTMGWMTISQSICIGDGTVRTHTEESDTMPTGFRDQGGTSLSFVVEKTMRRVRSSEVFREDASQCDEWDCVQPMIIDNWQVFIVGGKGDDDHGRHEEFCHEEYIPSV